MSFFIRNKTKSEVTTIRNKKPLVKSKSFGGKQQKSGRDAVRGSAPRRDTASGGTAPAAKRRDTVGGGTAPAAKRRKPNETNNNNYKGGLNDEIASDSDSDLDLGQDKINEKSAAAGGYSSEEDLETAQEKRIRLAKQYLSQLENEEKLQDEDREAQKDLIAHRLKQDVLEQSGRLHRYIADQFLPPEAEDISVLRAHQLPLTCLVISPDNKYIFTASKDCHIIKWNLETCQKIHTIKGGKKLDPKTSAGHKSHVLCLAISSDNKFLVSGDCDKLIHVWNPENCQHIRTFTGHRDSVSGLVFRKGSHQLFSSSHDRSVKIWDLDQMAYVETLFGHQDKITAIDSLSRERAITSGGGDRSIRIWKIIEESQLVFHGHHGSIDCVSLINEQHFVSGADDNSLAVWSVMKKKPCALIRNAHSNSTDDTEINTTSKPEENWISAVSSLQHTDLIASGSKDGRIRLWRILDDYRKLEPLFSVPVVGFVNSLQFASDGSFLVAAVGQEHKWGRWWRMKDAKNSLVIIRLKKKSET
ncbi:U3 small nucleolar RNA-interacting protein 2-like isoform X2 [Tubulanus polymorphus]|uniref:U3 small nucleolar RNA-interacting protein 2-like isoform X2 n=1 Tax=Tubulanus polymorphus TaxID=672921 RepID=UPI003DA44E69